MSSYHSRYRDDQLANRRWLNVPFAEKEEAKAVGARWDAQCRRWWIPDSVPESAIERWL